MLQPSVSLTILLCNSAALAHMAAPIYPSRIDVNILGWSYRGRNGKSILLGSPHST